MSRGPRSSSAHDLGGETERVGEAAPAAGLKPRPSHSTQLKTAERGGKSRLAAGTLDPKKCPGAKATLCENANAAMYPALFRRWRISAHLQGRRTLGRGGPFMRAPQ
jgi:hypothetical protein